MGISIAIIASIAMNALLKTSDFLFWLANNKNLDSVLLIEIVNISINEVIESTIGINEYASIDSRLIRKGGNTRPIDPVTMNDIMLETKFFLVWNLLKDNWFIY